MYQNLLKACQTGDLERVNHYLALDVNPIGPSWKCPYTQNIALRYAFHSGNQAVLDRLLAHPAVISQLEIYGLDILKDAIDAKNREFVRRRLIINPDWTRFCFIEEKYYHFVKEVWDEIQTDRKNMLMLFKAKLMQDGRMSVLPPEMLFKIASYIPNLRLHGMNRKEFEDHLHEGWNIVRKGELKQIKSLLRYYDTSAHMGKLMLHSSNDPASLYKPSKPVKRKGGRR